MRLISYSIGILMMFAMSSHTYAGDVRKVYTSEIIPGASCVCDYTSDVWDDEWNAPVSAIATTPGSCNNVPVAKRKYICTVGTWLVSFQLMFANIIKYLINIVLLLWVLAIVGLGIAWAWAGGDDVKMKSTLKKWGTNIVVGLIILYLFQYILRFLAPWIYK